MENNNCEGSGKENMKELIQSVDAPLRLRSKRVPADFNVEVAFSRIRGALRRAMQDDVVVAGKYSLHKRASFALTEAERLMVHFGVR